MHLYVSCISRWVLYNSDYVAIAKTNNSVFPLLGSLFSSHASKPVFFFFFFKFSMYTGRGDCHIIWLILSSIFVAKDKIYLAKNICSSNNIDYMEFWYIILVENEIMRAEWKYGLVFVFFFFFNIWILF